MNKITDLRLLSRRITFTLAILIAATSFVFAQGNDENHTYRILFRDKGGDIFAPGSELYRRTEKLHNARCIARRKKTNQALNNFSIEDAPVYQPYLDSLRDCGARLLLALRWNNYAVVSCDSTAAERVSKFKFVKFIQRTNSKLILASASNKAAPWLVSSQNLELSPIIQDQGGCGAFHYGLSYNQSSMIGVPELHSMGITGNGALICFLDSGFLWKIHDATKNADVIAEYDFINNDAITANESGDDPTQDNHGSMVFSIVAGFEQDSLIGVAPFASFMLAKTENITSETRIEEDNYAAAMEWAESQGADIVSSSLGYITFDAPGESYSFDDLNGHSTITADIVNKAVKRGVVCVTAAGNNGPKDQSIISPADADSAIAVGGLLPDGVTPAAFSSRGPNGRGVIKPDISTQATEVFSSVFRQQNGVRSGSGTSFATPLLAGSAALMVSAFPEKTTSEIRRALYETGSQAKVKDDVLGYGRANIPNAMLQLGTIVSPGYASYLVAKSQRFCFYIRSPYSYAQPRIVWYPAGTSLPQYYPLKAADKQYQFIADIPKSSFGINDSARFYLDVATSGDHRVMPYFSGGDEKTLPAKFGENTIACGIAPETLPLGPNIMTNVEILPNAADASIEQVAVSVPLDFDIPFTVEAYNTAGQRVWSNSFNSAHSQISTCYIPTRNLPIGYYFIVVRAAGRSMSAILSRL